MNFLDSIRLFFMRFRYPLALPKDISKTLGVYFSPHMSFEELINTLLSPNFIPKNLTKYMTRKEAEELFIGAQHKEIFLENTRISYYFKEGWVEFSLHFDNKNCLRRLYIQHKTCNQKDGIEIPLIKT